MSVGVSCFFQAEDGIRDLVRSRGLGDVYKRQILDIQPERLHQRVPFYIGNRVLVEKAEEMLREQDLSLIHI